MKKTFKHQRKASVSSLDSTEEKEGFKVENKDFQNLEGLTDTETQNLTEAGDTPAEDKKPFTGSSSTSTSSSPVLPSLPDAFPSSSSDPSTRGVGKNVSSGVLTGPHWHIKPALRQIPFHSVFRNQTSGTTGGTEPLDLYKAADTPAEDMKSFRRSGLCSISFDAFPSSSSDPSTRGVVKNVTSGVLTGPHWHIKPALRRIRFHSDFRKQTSATTEGTEPLDLYKAADTPAEDKKSFTGSSSCFTSPLPVLSFDREPLVYFGQETKPETINPDHSGVRLSANLLYTRSRANIREKKTIFPLPMYHDDFSRKSFIGSCQKFLDSAQPSRLPLNIPSEPPASKKLKVDSPGAECVAHQTEGRFVSEDFTDVYKDLFLPPNKHKTRSVPEDCSSSSSHVPGNKETQKWTVSSGSFRSLDSSDLTGPDLRRVVITETESSEDSDHLEPLFSKPIIRKSLDGAYRIFPDPHLQASGSGSSRTLSGPPRPHSCPSAPQEPSAHMKKQSRAGSSSEDENILLSSFNSQVCNVQVYPSSDKREPKPAAGDIPLDEPMTYCNFRRPTSPGLLAEALTQMDSSEDSDDLDTLLDELMEMEESFKTLRSPQPLLQASGCGSSRTLSGPPRPHSCPSALQEPSAHMKKQSRAGSLPSLKLQSSFQEFSPDLTDDDEGDEVYRFRCSGPGLYQCRETGLVFDMKAAGDVSYRTVPWDRRSLSQHCKKPAGPLFDITCPQLSVAQLHLPHCELHSTAAQDHLSGAEDHLSGAEDHLSGAEDHLSGAEDHLSGAEDHLSGAEDHLSVAHVDHEGMEFIRPERVTETHVVVKIRSFSAFGNVKDEDCPPEPVRALVLLFYKSPAEPGDDYLINVLLLPQNVPVGEVLRFRKKLDKTERFVESPPHCKLQPQQVYTLSTGSGQDSVLVQPKEAEFDAESYDNYLTTFQVVYGQLMKHMKLFLKDSSSSSVWDRRVCLSSSGPNRSCGSTRQNLSPDEQLSETRISFADGVSGPVLQRLLDKLLESKVLSDSEKEAAEEERSRRDRARFVIDTVRKKGPAAGSEMIQFLCELDPFLSEHLGLM